MVWLVAWIGVSLIASTIVAAMFSLDHRPQVRLLPAETKRRRLISSRS